MNTVFIKALPHKNDYVATLLLSRWHQRDLFPTNNVVSLGETFIICGIYLIAHRLNNKDVIIAGLMYRIRAHCVIYLRALSLSN